MADEPSTLYTKWRSEIERAKKADYYEEWCKKGEKIQKRYRDVRDLAVAGTGRIPKGLKKFNVLWSNVQTMRPALFARVPEPQVIRQFRDQDPVGRSAAEILERAMQTDLEPDDMHNVMDSVIEDYLLPGRGVAVVSYAPNFETTRRQVFRSDDGFEDGEGNEVDRDSVVTEGRGRGTKYFYEDNQLEGEWAPVSYFYWKDVLHKDVKTWKDLVKRGWIAFLERMTRKEIAKKFGEDKAKRLAGAIDKNSQEINPTYEVWMIWDGSKRRVMWMSTEFPEMLDDIEDPLELNGFYPTPRFLLATTTNDTLIPVPDYHEYWSQAVQLDELTHRISLLTEAVKISGVYDNSMPEIANVMKSENKLVGVDNWAVTGQGIEGHMSFLPIAEIVNALLQLTEAREVVKRDLYEITGIADIIRGQSDPRETMGAQRLKGRFATVRLSDRQREVQRYVRDVYALKGEVMVRHFSDETLLEKASWLRSAEMHVDPPNQQDPQSIQQFQAKMQQNIQRTQQALQLLKDDEMATFRLDIETDATLAMDDEEERQGRIQFMTAVGTFMSEAIAAGKENPSLAPILGQMLMFAIRGFPIGRELEGQIEDALIELKNAPPQQPPPDPAMEEVKRRGREDEMQARNNQEKNQITAAELALDWQKFMHEAGIDDATLDLKAREIISKNLLELAKDDNRAQTEQVKAVADTTQKVIEFMRGADGRVSGARVQ